MHLTIGRHIRRTDFTENNSCLLCLYSDDAALLYSAPMKTRAQTPLVVSYRLARGFTVLELMVAVSVMSILLSIGVPAFNDVVRNNQISAASSNMVAALTLARSEAMKRGTRVSLCAAAGPTACSASNEDWNNGWIVFADDFGAAGVMDEADSPLQFWTAPPDGVAVTTNAASVSFTRRARAEFARAFTVTKRGCSGNQRRLVDVNIAGRISLARQACT